MGLFGDVSSAVGGIAEGAAGASGALESIAGALGLGGQAVVEGSQSGTSRTIVDPRVEAASERLLGAGGQFFDLLSPGAGQQAQLAQQADLGILGGQLPPAIRDAIQRRFASAAAPTIARASQVGALGSSDVQNLLGQQFGQIQTDLLGGALQRGRGAPGQALNLLGAPLGAARFSGETATTGTSRKAQDRDILGQVTGLVGAVGGLMGGK